MAHADPEDVAPAGATREAVAHAVGAIRPRVGRAQRHPAVAPAAALELDADARRAIAPGDPAAEARPRSGADVAVHGVRADPGGHLHAPVALRGGARVQGAREVRDPHAARR